MHDRPLHFRGQRAGLLVDGNDPAGVDRILLGGAFVTLLPDDLVLRVRELVAAAAGQLQRAEQDDFLTRLEDIPEKRLVEVRHPQRAARILHDHVEDLESGPARRADAGAEDVDEQRCRLPRLQLGNHAELPAVLVPDRKPVQQVLDRREADALEVRRAPGADAFQGTCRGVWRNSAAEDTSV